MQAVMSLAGKRVRAVRGPHHRRRLAAGDCRRSACRRGLSRQGRGRPDDGGGKQPMPDALLAISGLRAGYGATEILRGVDLTVGPGEIVAVLGSNGTGKSTLNRTISGVMRASHGTIRFDGRGDRARAACGHRRARPHPRAGRPPHLSQSDRRRKSRPRRLSPRPRAPRNQPEPGVLDFPAARRTARPDAPAPCPAANSRCSPSGAA